MIVNSPFISFIFGRNIGINSIFIYISLAIVRKISYNFIRLVSPWGTDAKTTSITKTTSIFNINNDVSLKYVQWSLLYLRAKRGG